MAAFERPAWFDADEFPFESRWLDLDGHTLHYLDEGSGPVLLLAHGNPTWSFLYRRMIPLLSDRFRCIAPDLPGFGLSTAGPGFGFTAAEQSAVMSDFVAALDLSGITPVVQDWGGPVALGAAVRDPERYDRLVIGNTWAWPMQRRKMTTFSELMGGRFTGPLVTERLNLFVEQIIPRGLVRRRLSDAEMAMYRGPFRDLAARRPVRVFPRQITEAAPFLTEVEAGLPAIAGKPSLLFWADADIAFGDPERRRWEELLTDRTDYVLHGAGHYWQDDAGEEAAYVLRQWWDQSGTTTAANLSN